MGVSELMNRVMVITESLNLKEPARIMSKKNIGCLIVMKKDKITGIITERDVLKNIDKLNKKVSNVMSKDVITVEHDRHIDDDAELMSLNKVKRLPVVNKNKIIGIITATDLLAHCESLNDSFFF